MDIYLLMVGFDEENLTDRVMELEKELEKGL